MGAAPLSSRFKGLLGYASMLALAVAAFFLIRAHGETLRAPLENGAVRVTAGKSQENLLLQVLLALGLIVVGSRALGAVFRRLKQPPVIGEMVAGILLGPSLFGRVLPKAQAFFFPTQIAPYLSVIAGLGVILFMFLVGLELDTRALRRHSHSTLLISHASIVVPFLLGTVLALWLYPELSVQHVGFTNFSLFMGVSLSITAFPVLARILTDGGMQRSHLGNVALACAAVDDVTGWCLLALVMNVVHARSSRSLLTLALTLGYVLFMLLVVRPLLGRWVARQELTSRSRSGASALVLVAVLASAALTEAIGIHALFGAFLLGALIPCESRVARELRQRLEEIVVVLLLPVLFAFTGLRTQIALLANGSDWLYCGAILLVACVGKFGGSSVAARLSGLGWRDAASLGILMNTRGLVELIVLNVGFDLGVISSRVFTMLVIMALVTTFATSPLLQLMKPRTAVSGGLEPARV